MAPREFRHGLDDMLSAINGLLQAVTGKSYEDYRDDWLLRHAIERGIEIISEASRVLPEEIKALRPEIPWARVKAIGNVLRNEYHNLSTPIIWRVVVDELPRLREAILAIKAQVGEEDQLGDA